MSDVLVIGAHGKIALLAQELLVTAGHTVTGAIRNPTTPTTYAPPGRRPSWPTWSTSTSTG